MILQEGHKVTTTSSQETQPTIHPALLLWLQTVRRKAADKKEPFKPIDNPMAF